MAVYEIQGQEFEIPDEVQGAQLEQTLMELSEMDLSEQGLVDASQRGEKPELTEPALKQDDGVIQGIPGAPPVLEFMAAMNRVGAGIVDFLSTDQINAVLELSGSEARVPTVSGAAESAVTGNFMEPGLPRRMVRTGGEVAASVAVPGQALRSLASQAPKIAPTLTQQVIKSAASKPLPEVISGAIAGAGSEVGADIGEAVGGETGREVGRIAGGILAPITGIATKETLKRGVKSLGLKAAERATGVKLFEAQATAVPSRLEEQAFVASLPSGAKTARAALLKQNQQAAKAVDDVLDIIAPPSSLETGAEKFRTVAQRAFDSLKAIRAGQASPLYNAAFENKSAIPLRGLAKAIDDTILDFPEGGEIARSLLKVRRFIGNGDKNIKQLHNAKVEIDQMISKVGEGSLGDTTKMQLMSAKTHLLSIMDDANPIYREARAEFSRLSPAVDRFEQSMIGRITKLKDPQLKTISKKIFDPAETDPSLIVKAKETIEAIDPQAWREITRIELQRRLGSVRGDIQDAALGVGASIENLPAQLSRAIFGNEAQRRVLLKGAPGDAAKNLKYLQSVLGRAKLGRPGGSQTAAREEIKKQLRPGVFDSIRNFIQAPLRATTSLGEEAAFNRKVSVLSKALYSTEWKAEMKKIRRLKPNTAAAAKAMTALLADIEKTEANE